MLVDTSSQILLLLLLLLRLPMAFQCDFWRRSWSRRVASDIPYPKSCRGQISLCSSTHHHKYCCCCCCCCDCQCLFSVTFGAGRGVESLSNSIRSPFGERLLCRCTLLSQVTLFAKIAILDVVLGVILPINSFLITIPMTVRVHLLLRNCGKNHGVLSSSGSPPKWFSGVKKIVCRPLWLSFPPGISPFQG